MDLIFLKDALKKHSSLCKLKIPVNVSEMFYYENIFRFVLANGFVPEPYLSASKYSIRSGQDNKKNFMKYMETFLKYKRELGILPGFVHLVYNARYGGSEVITDIDSTLNDLKLMGYKQEELNLIIAYPPLIKRYVSSSVNVTVSSASVIAYKRIIDLLIECPLSDPPNVSYVLPSTYQFTIRKLPPNSFEIMVNNGCMLGCINATVATDHTKFCPIKRKDLKELYYDQFQKKTDVIPNWRFKSLLDMGWRSFKIAGRQASPSVIFDVIRYYLDADTDRIPYIDNPLFYGGKSSNG